MSTKIIKAATYTKLRSGDWGIRVVGDKPSVGMTISVKKRSGDAKSETVDKVIWSGTDDKTGAKIHLCAIAKKAAQASADGYYCGHICPVNKHRCSPKYGPCHDCE